MNQAANSYRDVLLFVDKIRLQRQRSPGLANGPFSDEALDVIADALSKVSQLPGPKTPLPPHLRGLLIERMAKALCQHAYPARTLDEAVSPSRQLWMRMIPEAELALQAVDDFTKALDEVSSFATGTPQEKT